MSTRNDDTWMLGETWGEEITCTASDGTPLTPSAVSWLLKVPNGASVLEKTEASGDVTIVGNVVTITVPTTDQDNLASRAYWRRLKITDQNGAQSRQVHGFITVLPND